MVMHCFKIVAPSFVYSLHIDTKVIVIYNVYIPFMKTQFLQEQGMPKNLEYLVYNNSIQSLNNKHLEFYILI